MFVPLSDIWIIGCGGVASYFMPAFIKLMNYGTEKPPTLYFIDGDVLEEKNLLRQLFSFDDVGVKKAEAFQNIYGPQYKGKIVVEPNYFSSGANIANSGVRPNLICCFADNHSCRKEVLAVCDKLETSCIIAGNGKTDADAYYYKFGFKDKKDPRVRYPEILTDERDNPIRAPGCVTEEALIETPQLASANMLAAAFSIHILVSKFSTEFLGVDEKYSSNLHTCNFNAIQSIVV